MTPVTGAQRFLLRGFSRPKRMRRAKERIERVQLLTASARERATELAQKYERLTTWKAASPSSEATPDDACRTRPSQGSREWWGMSRTP